MAIIGIGIAGDGKTWNFDPDPDTDPDSDPHTPTHTHTHPHTHRPTDLHTRIPCGIRHDLRRGETPLPYLASRIPCGIRQSSSVRAVKDDWVDFQTIFVFN